MTKGSQISRGTTIGYVGTTGTSSTGVHLHLDVSETVTGSAYGPSTLEVEDCLNPLAFFTFPADSYTITNGIIFGSDMN